MPNDIHVFTAHSLEAFCGWEGEPTAPPIRWNEHLVRPSEEGHLYDTYVDMHTRGGDAMCQRCDAVARRLIAIRDENVENVVRIRLRGSATARPRSRTLRRPFDLSRYPRLSAIEQAIRDDKGLAHELDEIQSRFRSRELQNVNGAALELSVYGLLCQVDGMEVVLQPDEGRRSRPDIKLTWQQDIGIGHSQPMSLYLDATYVNPVLTHLDSVFMSDVCGYIWEMEIPGWKAVIAPIDGEVFNPVPRENVQNAVRARLAGLNPAHYEACKVSPLAYQGVPAMTLKLVDADEHTVDIGVDFIPAPGNETLHAGGGGGGASIASPIDPIKDAIKRKSHQHPQFDPLIVAVHHPEANHHEVERALYGTGSVLAIDPTDFSRAIDGWPQMDGVWRPDGGHHEGSGAVRIPRPLAVLWCDSPFREEQSQSVLYVPPSWATTYLGPLLDAFPIRYLASEVKTLG